MDGKYPDFDRGELVVPEDRAVQQVVQQEMKYKRELWRLQKVLRKGLFSDDPLPVTTRRQIVQLVMRLCNAAKRSTSRLRTDMNMAEVCEVLQDTTSASHGLLCVSYSDILNEIREFLRNEMLRRGDSTIFFCQEMHGERALLPLHRLKYLKSLSCLSPEHTDSLTSALDSCLAVISTYHSQTFVTKIDYILDFALNMDPPPSEYYTVTDNSHIYQELLESKLSSDSLNDHEYEEIRCILPKKKKTCHFFKKIFSKTDISSDKDEFIPLADYAFPGSEKLS